MSVTFPRFIVLATLGAPMIAPAQLSGSRPAARADTARYAVLNHGRPTGEMDVVSVGDSVEVRWRFAQRGTLTRHVTTYALDARGLATRLARSATTGAGAAGATLDRFGVEAGIARWSSPGESGRAPARDAAYLPRDPIPYDIALLARAVLRRPGRTLALLPAGAARVSIVADTTLVVGGARRRLRLALVDSLHVLYTYHFSGPVWLGDDGALVASEASGLFVVVRRGDESVLPTLRRIELAVAGRRAEALARRLAPRATDAVVIRNGSVFDSQRGVVRPRTTVVVRGDRVVAIGPADSIATPRGATVIDATGRTVLPGLWDMHTHSGDPFLSGPASGLLWLAAGITTARDLMADIDVAVPLRDRAQAGRVLSPRLILAGLMDGPGDDVAPTDVVVATREDALAWIARYDSLGYRQIKIYNLIPPELVPAIAGEAHRRGMRVSGHIPRGMTLHEAVRDGFDEVNHARFAILAFFPDSAWRGSRLAPTLAGFDVSSPQMTDLIALLKERGTVVDGTFNLREDRSQLLPDGTHPVFGPTLAWMPPLMRRSLTSAPSPSPEAAAQAQAVAANMHRLVKRLFDAGVTLVAGTDFLPGLSYHGELEIYQRSGIPAASVLQIATIVPARVMGEERDYGSIAPGKVADLVIVDGHPEQDVRDLRRAEWVLRAGRPYRTADLYRAAGLTPAQRVTDTTTRR